jgi:hypothetical protein
MRGHRLTLLIPLLFAASAGSYAQDPEVEKELKRLEAQQKELEAERKQLDDRAKASECNGRIIALMGEQMKGLKEGAPTRKGRIDECALASRELKTNQEVAQKWRAEDESCRNSELGKKLTSLLNQRIREYGRDAKKHCR